MQFIVEKTAEGSPGSLQVACRVRGFGRWSGRPSPMLGCRSGVERASMRPTAAPGFREPVWFGGDVRPGCECGNGVPTWDRARLVCSGPPAAWRRSPWGRRRPRVTVQLYLAPQGLAASLCHVAFRLAASYSSVPFCFVMPLRHVASCELGHVSPLRSVSPGHVAFSRCVTYRIIQSRRCVWCRVVS